MIDDKVKKEIEAVVASIFSEKEEEDARTRTEEALSTSASTIEELTNTLESKNAEVSELETKVSETEEKISDLESQLEAAKTETASVTEQLTEANQKMEDMAKDKAADDRMSTLEEAGVARSDRDGQRTKVREMSDEDFASYKDELQSIREAVIAELKATSEEVKEEAKEEETKEEESEDASEEETDEEEASEEDEEVATPPANIDPGKAIASALNFEVYPSDDLKKKYGALGDAMAAAFKK
jgi:septal ring factor EnvC (AmiA/AmiB activator)